MPRDYHFYRSACLVMIDYVNFRVIGDRRIQKLLQINHERYE